MLNFFWESRTFLLTLKQILSLTELLNTGINNRYGISVPLKIFSLHDFPIPSLWTMGGGEKELRTESIWGKVANIRYRKYYLGKYSDFRECSSWSGFLFYSWVPSYSSVTLRHVGMLCNRSTSVDPGKWDKECGTDFFFLNVQGASFLSLLSLSALWSLSVGD